MTSSISMPTTHTKKEPTRSLIMTKSENRFASRALHDHVNNLSVYRVFNALERVSGRQAHLLNKSFFSSVFFLFSFVWRRRRSDERRKIPSFFLASFLLNFVLLFYFFGKKGRWRRRPREESLEEDLSTQNHSISSSTVTTTSLKFKMLTQCQQEGFLLPFTIFVLYKHTL